MRVSGLFCDRRVGLAGGWYLCQTACRSNRRQGCRMVSAADQGKAAIFAGGAGKLFFDGTVVAFAKPAGYVRRR